MEWRPIETAPNGVQVLVWGRTWDRWEGDQSDAAQWSKPEAFVAEVMSDKRGPVAYVYNGHVTGDSAECRPTHWMPLPSPPEAS